MSSRINRTMIILAGVNHGVRIRSLSGMGKNPNIGAARLDPQGSGPHLFRGRGGQIRIHLSRPKVGGSALDRGQGCFRGHHGEDVIGPDRHLPGRIQRGRPGFAGLPAGQGRSLRIIAMQMAKKDRRSPGCQEFFRKRKPFYRSTRARSVISFSRKTLLFQRCTVGRMYGSRRRE
jgi:hypothetical protein